MPNHIQNVIQFRGDKDKIKELFDFVKTEEEFDFNKLIPMPESIKNTESSTESDKALAYYVAKVKNEVIKSQVIWCNYNSVEETIEDVEKNIKDSKDIEKLLSTGEHLYNNIKLYGVKSWYDWSLKNWGTKWNAYESSFDENSNVISFQTAWCVPSPIAEALSKKFPDVDFIWSYADEDVGANVGVIGFYEGSFTIEECEDYSSDAYRIYVECWGDVDFIYIDEDGNYRAKE